MTGSNDGDEVSTAQNSGLLALAPAVNLQRPPSSTEMLGVAPEYAPRDASPHENAPGHAAATPFSVQPSGRRQQRGNGASFDVQLNGSKYRLLFGNGLGIGIGIG